MVQDLNMRSLEPITTQQRALSKTTSGYNTRDYLTPCKEATRQVLNLLTGFPRATVKTKLIQENKFKRVMVNLSIFETVFIKSNLADQVYQGFENIKTAFNQTAGKTASSAFEATGQAIDTLTDTAHKTQASLKQTANQFINTMGETGEQGKGVLGDTFQTAAHLNNAVSQTIEQALNAVLVKQMNNLNAWMNDHPVLSEVTKSLVWGINHPILGLIILLFALFTIWQLFKAMGRLFEQALVALLKAPFKFVRFLFTLSFKPFSKSKFKEATIQQSEANSLVLNPAIPSLTPQEHKERIAKILARIEVIRQEQNDLLKELTTLLASDKLSA